MTEITPIVAEKNASTISVLGILNSFISLDYTKEFRDSGKFKLVIPFSKTSLSLISHRLGVEKLVNLEGSIWGVIEKYQCDPVKNNKITIQGKLVEGLLENVAMMPFQFPISSSVTPWRDIDIRVVLNNRFSSDPWLRSTWWNGIVLPESSDFVEVDNFKMRMATLCKEGTFQANLKLLCNLLDTGYTLRYSSEDAKFHFEYQVSRDRSIHQTTYPQVCLSTAFSSLIDSKYTFSSEKYKNVIAVGSFYTDSSGSTTFESELVTYDDTPIESMDKNSIRAKYIEVEVSSGSSQSLSQYHSAMRSAGKEELYNSAFVKSYEAEVDESLSIYKFNRDYFLGDYITIHDEILDITIDVQMLGYTKSYTTNTEKFKPIFGVPLPEINQILKRKGII